MNKGVKIGLWVLAGTAIVTVSFFVGRKLRIDRQTRKLEAEGFTCGGCPPSGVKTCVKDGQATLVNCHYRLLA